MPASPKDSLYMLKKTNEKGTTRFVGAFFELLSKTILKAQPGSEGTEDLSLQRIETGVEVKSGDSRNGIRIPADQFDSHTSQLGIFPSPYDKFLYCMGCYHNHLPRSVSPQQRSALARCKNELAVYAHLAQNTDTLYVFDHRVVDAIRTTHGYSKRQLPGQPDKQHLGLFRKFLRRFTEENASTILKELSLFPSAWSVRERQVLISIRVGLYTYRLDLDVVEILDRDFVPSYDLATRVPHGSRPSRRTLCVPLETDIGASKAHPPHVHVAV